MNHIAASWASEAIFYHIYPLGLCGAPSYNDFVSPAAPRLESVHNWISHIKNLGCNALYLGPVSESGTHGYDTADYYTVDRRLGTNETLKELIAQLHANGIKVILDGVFNHVGRDFWAFRDLLANGENSPYRDWFAGVDFSRSSPYGDAFAYEGWNGHHILVKLNLHHPDVRAHLFAAIKMWVEEFKIDGLRLDAADVMDLSFLRDLARFCHELQANFWLLGEVIHGDYRRWANPEMLDSTTNYECYKGLHSSHNDKNYFELAHSLNRLFGEQGIYKNLSLYSFVDNHDVNRIASTLQNPTHLYPLHILLFTMPGVPSIYYGSEWGISGTKLPDTDAPLRPKLLQPEALEQKPHPALADTISRLAGIRKKHAALKYGSYQQVHVAHEQLAFARRTKEEHLIVVVNAASTQASLSLKVEVPDGRTLVDLLEPQQQFSARNGQVQIDVVPACWARILQVQ
ncbi:alpha-amylase family glycosyl hydrolase [Pontibacter pamirensis]|uniref:alpha-amylase family glycosyl hydrolase n=1 Tax=Pontibacter pamirensis TaxID=2562824 RepID=UPI00138975A9|nr:alpha-amylase family glycosyl hydrolase [Pontibacter pamirensis]